MTTSTIPPYIGSRGVQFDQSAQLETGRPLRFDVRTKATRSLVWASTRTRYFPRGQWLSFGVDESGVLTLPCTDLVGWVDPATGDVVDPAVGPTHQYVTTIAVYDGSTQVFTETVGPYPLPSGAAQLPWALLRNLGFAAGATSNGAQVFDLSDGGEFPPAAPEGAWGVDLTPVETVDGRAVTFYRLSEGGKELFSRLVLPRGEKGDPASTEEIAALTAQALAAAGTAGTAAGEAGTLATAAAGSAAAALESKNAAAQSANTADSRATNASSSATGASNSATSAASSAAAAGEAAGAASQSAIAAGQSATAAGQSATSSGQAKTAAEAAANLALAGQFAGSDLGTVHLDTVTTPGKYRQSSGTRATIAQGYPDEGSPVALTVETSGTGGSGLVQRAVIPWRTGRAGMGEYIRTRFASTDAWGPWRFSPVLNVDQTAGRTLSVWDPINQRPQLIHSDTGRRNITASLTTTTPITSGGVFLSRVGYLVSLELSNVVIQGQAATTNYTFDDALPVGFRSPGASRLALAQVVASSGVLTVYGSGSSRIVITPGTTSPLYQTVSWRTVDPMPAALPGVGDGTIPST